MKEKELRKVADRKQGRIETLQQQIIVMKSKYEDELSATDMEVQDMCDQVAKLDEELLCAKSLVEELTVETNRLKVVFASESSNNKVHKAKISQQTNQIKKLEEECDHLKREAKISINLMEVSKLKSDS